MISIENLRKVYDNGYEALKDIDLEIPKGALVCLLGPSGCGKSTILNIIAGLLDPTSGDIKFNGESVVNLHPKDRNIGMVFQNYALYPHMSVLENVIFPLTVGKNKISKAEASKVAEKYMELTSIMDIKDKMPGALSGGQQQRVAITRALVQNPSILLLDEPLSNLDARLRLRIREEIRNIVKSVGVTTVFVTHDQEEALSISDYIAIMDEGVIQQYDIPQNLYLEPANLFVAKFIGSPEINIYNATYNDKKLNSKGFSISCENLLESRICDNFIEDENYLIGIRPENFILDNNGEIETIIESVEVIGRYLVLHFNLGDISSRAVVDSKVVLKEGDKARFKIDLDNSYIFETSGRRVY